MKEEIQIEKLINSFSDSYLASNELKKTLDEEKKIISDSQDEIRKMIKNFNDFVVESKNTILEAKTEVLTILENIRSIYNVEKELRNQNANSIEELRKYTENQFIEIDKKFFEIYLPKSNNKEINETDLINEVDTENNNKVTKIENYYMEKLFEINKLQSEILQSWANNKEIEKK